MASAADVTIERIPIGAAQLFQCRLGCRTRSLPRREHHAPVGRVELCDSVLINPRILVAHGHDQSMF